jgi:hypothetical protein
MIQTPDHIFTQGNAYRAANYYVTQAANNGLDADNLMGDKKRVLLVGLAPEHARLIHTMNITPEQLVATLNSEVAALKRDGYDVEMLMTDAGETAERVLAARLLATSFDCVMIGAGVRSDPGYFALFEKLINVVHRHAPAAAICFNTRPGDTADAVRRWV